MQSGGSGDTTTTPNAPTEPAAAAPTEEKAAQASGKSLSWLSVYFTDPNPPDNLGHGIDQNVKAAFDAAQTSIDVTSFDLNLPDLINAMVAASQRGVKVRVVYDGTNGNLDLNNAASANKDFQTVKVLKAAKIAMVDGGRTNGLMHDKMVIVDGKTLFMGSWNLAYNDTYRNNNNLLKITNTKIIANYQAKFNELFVDKKFGTHAEVKVPYPSLSISSVQVENYFSPEDQVMDKIIALVQGAKKSVHFMAFTYTHQGLATAMIEQARAGLDVQGVIENRGASQGALPALYCAKLPVKIDGNKYTMHHKVIILDGSTVITGSFNFTNSADNENDDNIIVIHSASVAALYEKEYQKIYAQGTQPDSTQASCK
jgi:phosphatidylserine/phosphatidylglycerophosphate/cardiolipin synthase-like enzyme